MVGAVNYTSSLEEIGIKEPEQLQVCYSEVLINKHLFLSLNSSSLFFSLFYYIFCRFFLCFLSNLYCLSWRLWLHDKLVLQPLNKWSTTGKCFIGITSMADKQLSLQIPGFCFLRFLSSSPFLLFILFLRFLPSFHLFFFLSAYFSNLPFLFTFLLFLFPFFYSDFFPSSILGFLPTFFLPLSSYSAP